MIFSFLGGSYNCHMQIPQLLGFKVTYLKYLKCSFEISNQFRLANLKSKSGIIR
jgi:hypothetical protein